jgi:D-arabinose 1-dehydrogenase-like Zn-dependent alcohol dehydrogenase
MLTDPEYIVSPAIHVTKIPSELAPDVAAPLLCGKSVRHKVRNTL